MCLVLMKSSAKDRKNFRRRKTPIIAFKLLNPDLKSQFNDFQYKVGINHSGRKSTSILPVEHRTEEINKGFHLYLEEPKECRCPSLCPCLCRYQYLYQCWYNKLVKFEIDPKDIVAVGRDNSPTGPKSIVVTKAKMLPRPSNNNLCTREG